MECGIIVGVDDQLADFDGVVDLYANQEQFESIFCRRVKRPFGNEEAVTFWGVQDKFLCGPRCICYLEMKGIGTNRFARFHHSPPITGTSSPALRAPIASV